MAEIATQEATNWTTTEPVPATAPEAEVTEGKAESAKQLQEKKTYTEEEVAGFKADLLKERQTITKHTTRIKELEAKTQLTERQASELAGLNTRLDEQELLQAQILDTLKGQGAEIPQEQPQSYAAQVMARRQQRMQAQPVMQSVGEPTDEAYVSIKELVTTAGLEMNNPKFDYASYLYRSGKNVSALNEVKKTLAGETKVSETSAQIEARLEAKIMAKLGLDSVDTSLAAGGGTRSYTRKQIADMSPEDYEKNEAAIKSAQTAGRIK